LKDTTKKILSSLESILDNNLVTKLTANVVEYPFFVDFLAETSIKKVAIFIMDFSKFYLGVHNIVHQQIRESMDHFRNRGYQLVEINYEDFTINDKEMKIKKKLEIELF
jgi:hypothetical protein